MPRFVRLLCSMFICLLIIETAYAKPFIIDTDVGVDDVIAMLYLLQRSDIQIKAITIASDGNAHCQPALNNTLGILQMMQQSTIPVACGQDNPLIGGHHFPASVLDESDTLGGAAKWLPSTKPKIQQNAVDLMIKTIQEASDPVTILAIGPLTNIAQALQQSPKIKDNIRIIYIMGCAIHVQGNILEVDPASKNQTAEWNMYLDPLAEKIVLNQKIPIVLVPLDITNQLPIDMKFYRTVKNTHHTPSANYVFLMLKNNIKMIQAQWWYFWDPLAAVIASDESIADFQTQNLSVIMEPESRAGTTVIDNHNGNKIRIVTQVNQERFKSMLLDVLNVGTTLSGTADPARATTKATS